MLKHINSIQRKYYLIGFTALVLAFAVPLIFSFYEKYKMPESLSVICGFGCVIFTIADILTFTYSFSKTAYRFGFLFSLFFLSSIILTISGNFTNDTVSINVYRFLCLSTAFAFLLFTLFNPRIYDIFISLLVVLFIFGLVLKILHLPGAGPMLLIPGTFNSLIFLGLMIRLILQFNKNKTLAFTGILVCLGSGFMFLGGTFKLMHFPEANMLLAIGAPTYLIASILLLLGVQNPKFVEWQWKEKRTVYFGFLVPMVFIFLVFGFVFLFPEQWDYLLHLSVEPWGMEVE